MNNDLEWRLELANENDEKIEISVESGERHEERICLTVPAYKDEKRNVSQAAQHIHLTGREFDEIEAVVWKFRNMKRVRNGEETRDQ